MVLELEEADETTTANLQMTKRRIQWKGVQVFEQFYFHPDFAAFTGELVEVRYRPEDNSRVSVVLPNYKVVQATTINVADQDNQFVENSFELIQLKAINRMLVAACYDALQLRGLWTAINEPLGLEMERNEHRTQFKKIELSIRAVIQKAEEQEKCQKQMH